MGFEEPHLRLMLYFVVSDFLESPIFLLMRLIRVDWCCDIALNNLERSVTTWVRALGTHVYYLVGVS